MIFWLTEWVGYRFIPNESGRYVGGVIGLGLGYFCKYRMDRRWVFKS
jgi:formate/nitrite transporter FocA (FNT family)